MKLFNNDWDKVLEQEIQKKYFRNILHIMERKYQVKDITPPKERLFLALQKTPFSQVRVVILGQDPYPEKGVATGLAFATFQSNEEPKTLVNIKKLLSRDQGVTLQNNELEHWAEQGVLLLNAVLTTEVGKVGAHQKMGWEVFTDAVIRKISDDKAGVVFVLLGRKAQEKVKLIDETKHHIIQTTHPSPLSAHRGFMDSQLFRQINEKLTDKIKW